VGTASLIPLPCYCLHIPTHRLSILINDDLPARLRRESDRTGAPVGELVRRAIGQALPVEDGERATAGRFLLELSTPAVAEPDWEQQKDELLDDLGRAPSQST